MSLGHLNKCPRDELEFISGRRGASGQGNCKINPVLYSAICPLYSDIKD
jgi:hypothetical protein